MIRQKFEAIFETLDLEKTKDAWGNEVYKHPHVRSLYDGFRAAVGEMVLPEGYVAVPESMIREIGSFIPCVTGGNFEKDTPDAIIQIVLDQMKVYREKINEFEA